MRNVFAHVGTFPTHHDSATLTSFPTAPAQPHDELDKTHWDDAFSPSDAFCEQYSWTNSENVTNEQHDQVDLAGTNLVSPGFARTEDEESHFFDFPEFTFVNHESSEENSSVSSPADPDQYNAQPLTLLAPTPKCTFLELNHCTCGQSLTCHHTSKQEELVTALLRKEAQLSKRKVDDVAAADERGAKRARSECRAVSYGRSSVDGAVTAQYLLTSMLVPRAKAVSDWACARCLSFGQALIVCSLSHILRSWRASPPSRIFSCFLRQSLIAQ